MKKCIKCNEEKELTEFRFRKDNNKYRNDCLVCQSEISKKWRLNNKEYITLSKKKDRLFKKEHYRVYMRNYRKERRKTDSLFKLRDNISSLILISIKNNGYKKNTKTESLLGCSFEEFKIHLQKQFTEGMSWENQGQWHMDHIYPVSLAKNEEHLIKLNHYTNFQPLWAIDNIKKGNKII